MSPVKTVGYDKVQELLVSFHCKPLEGKTPLNSADWWRYPWGGAPFTVSREQPFTQTDLDILLEKLMAAVPPGWTWDVGEQAEKTLPNVEDC